MPITRLCIASGCCLKLSEVSASNFLKIRNHNPDDAPSLEAIKHFGKQAWHPLPRKMFQHMGEVNRLVSRTGEGQSSADIN
jgi:hypothetical protein